MLGAKANNSPNAERILIAFILEPHRSSHFVSERFSCSEPFGNLADSCDQGMDDEQSLISNWLLLQLQTSRLRDAVKGSRVGQKVEQLHRVPITVVLTQLGDVGVRQEARRGGQLAGEGDR